LKSLLEVAQAVQPPAQGMRTPASAQKDSRRRFLSQAGRLRQRRSAASLWAALHFLRHNLASAVFALAAIALLLVGFGSANALPGDGLYPVKLTAEGVGASLASRPGDPLEREASADQRRVREVEQMIASGRTGPVQFAGFLDPADGPGWLVAGIVLVLDENQAQAAGPLSGGYVEVKGTLNQGGQVEVTQVQPRLATLKGSLQRLEAGRWVMDGTIVLLTGETRVHGNPQVGSRVTLQAARTRDPQQVLALEVSVEDSALPGPAPTLSPTPRPSSTPTPTLTPAATETLPPGQQILPNPTGAGDDHDAGDPQDDEPDPDEGDDDHSEEGDGQGDN
jgi:hypothetical protein